VKRIIKIRERKDRAKWEVDYRDHEGKRFRPLFDTEQEALDFAAEKRKELADGPGVEVEHKDITLRDYATLRLDVWRQHLAPRTLRSYEGLLTIHLLPALGHVKVRELKRRHVKQLLDQKQRGGLGGQSLRLIRSTLSVLLSDAVDDEIITANPCMGWGKRKRTDPGTAPRPEIRPLTREQRDAALAEAGNHPDRRPPVLFELLAKAGLRPSEAYALTPGDVDFTGGTLRVERGLEMKRRTVRATKTYERRAVDLTPEMVRTLKSYLPWLTALALRRGWGTPEWLFPADDGLPMAESTARKTFKRALKDAGLPDFRMYDLRHTFASLLLAEGAPLTYVSAQLGHRNPTTTLKHYLKWVPVKGQRWVNVLDSQEPKKWNQKYEAQKIQVVTALGALANDQRALGEKLERRNDPRAHHGVLAHQLPLGCGQRTGFSQHRFRDGDLAQIVEQSRLRDEPRLDRRQAEAQRELPSQPGHPLGMTARVRILGFERVRQSQEALEECPLKPPVDGGEFPGIAERLLIGRLEAGVGDLEVLLPRPRGGVLGSEVARVEEGLGDFYLSGHRGASGSRE
jgi:integrase